MIGQTITELWTFLFLYINCGLRATCGQWVCIMQPVSLIHSFISGMHHYECIVPNVDINLCSGRSPATSTASFRERSSRVVFIHILWKRPSGLLQFSRGKLC